MKPALKTTAQYLRLVSNWPPRPIRDKKAHTAALRMLEELGTKDMSTEELDYFEVVSMLVEAYETRLLQTSTLAEPRAFLLAEIGLKQSD